MKYSKTVVLKDGRTCIIRNGTRQDAQGVWDNFVLTHGETEYLTTYPEEVTFTGTRLCWLRSTGRLSERQA